MAELQQEGGNLLARRFASEQHHLVLRRRQLAGGHDQQAPLQLGQLDEQLLELAARETTQPHRRQRLGRSEEHTSELQSLMRISYAVFCLKKHTQAISSCQEHTA